MIGHDCTFHTQSSRIAHLSHHSVIERRQVLAQVSEINQLQPRRLKALHVLARRCYVQALDIINLRWGLCAHGYKIARRAIQE